jgi:Phosphoesterase family
VKAWLLSPLHKAIAAAATLTGKKFGLLVASSVVATSVIVASAMTATNGSGPLAALLGRSLAADHAPAVTEPAPEEETYEPSSSSGSEASSPASASPSATPTPASELEEGPGEQPSQEPKEEPSEEPAPETGPAGHVFVVSVASPGYEAAFGETAQMPYLASTLRPQGLLLTNYELLGEAAPANAIATVAGQPPNASTKAGCPTYNEVPASAKANKRGVIAASGCVYPVTTVTLADQLGSTQHTWHAYLEGMVDESGKAANCVHPEADAAETPAAGAYSSKLNPFAYFHSLLDLGDCATNDVPLTGLEKDLKKVDTTADYTYVSPTPCTAGFAGQCPEGTTEGPAAADAFLAKWVPKILSSPAYKKDGLLIVTFSAVSPPTAASADGTTGATGSTAATAAASLKTGTLLVSNYLSPGSTDGAAYNPHSLLRSSEELFGLTLLGEAQGEKVKTFVPALRGGNGGD